MHERSDDSVLQVDNLAVEIGGRCVVDNLSLSLGQGERACLIGPSGSGKSLSAGAILGITPATARVSGRVRINGVDVGGLRATRRPRAARAGMVFQDTHAALNPLVSVGAQLREPFLRFHGLSRREATRAALALLERMHLGGHEAVMERSPAELSGGQRQRICLALALACKPSLIVADEPTTALDVLTQAEVLTLLRETTGTADTPSLLFISHDMGAARQLCDRAVIMEGGQVIETGRLETLIEQPREPFTRDLIAAMQGAEAPFHAFMSGASEPPSTAPREAVRA